VRRRKGKRKGLLNIHVVSFVPFLIDVGSWGEPSLTRQGGNGDSGD